MSSGNAVENLKVIYLDGKTFRGVNDVRVYLTTQGFSVSHGTAGRLDSEARNQLAHDGHAIQDPTSDNNWTRTGVATTEDIEKSRRRAVRYLRTFTKNLAAKLNVDASQPDASPEAVANQALLSKATEFTQVLLDY